MKDAKKSLVPQLKFNGNIYKFDIGMFDLSHFNIAELNEQMSNIPTHLAWIGTVLSEAESNLKKIQTVFSIWKADKMAAYTDLGSEKAKENQLATVFSGAIKKSEKEIREAESNVRILKVYKEGLILKGNLAQTIAANNRAERDAYAKNTSL